MNLLFIKKRWHFLYLYSTGFKTKSKEEKTAPRFSDKTRPGFSSLQPCALHIYRLYRINPFLTFMHRCINFDALISLFIWSLISRFSFFFALVATFLFLFDMLWEKSLKHFLTLFLFSCHKWIEFKGFYISGLRWHFNKNILRKPHLSLSEGVGGGPGLTSKYFLLARRACIIL